MNALGSEEAPRPPLLVVFAGLPGTGKTTMAHRLAQRLSAVFLTVDSIEAAIWRAGISRQEATGLAAYTVAQAVAEGALSAGTTVVADAVNPVEAARQAWRETARRTFSVIRVIETTCSDADEHRRRVQRRRPDPTRRGVWNWKQVLAQQYEPWLDSQPRLVLDTCRMTHTDCMNALDHYLLAART